MDRFMDALEQGNLETLRKYPKADLHNHFALGGSRRFLYQATGKKIEPLVHPLASMAEMDQWSQKYIGQYFNSTEGRKLLIRATFQQAKEDGVTVLEKNFFIMISMSWWNLLQVHKEKSLPR